MGKKALGSEAGKQQVGDDAGRHHHHLPIPLLTRCFRPALCGEEQRQEEEERNANKKQSSAAVQDVTLSKARAAGKFPTREWSQLN